MHGTADRTDDTVAKYSSRGPAWYSGLAKPDLVAPGHRLVAVGAYDGYLYGQYAERRVLGRGGEKRARYLRLSGTSMASAVTSGVVALMLEANRDKYDARLTPNTVKAILEYSALPMSAADPLSQGAGGLNGAGAVQLATTIDPGRSVGEWWLTGPLNPWTFIDGQSFVWSQTVVWGNTVVWGTGLFQNQTAWGQTVVWGTTVVWGNTDLVWDDPYLWGQTVVWGNGYLGATSGSSLGPSTVVWGNLTH
jgi:serine protease AprX